MNYYNEDYLYHFGVKGMKWGVRRYQNKDGTLTPTGKKRYSESDDSETKKAKRGLSDKQKRALKIGAAVAGTTLAAYGAYKLGKHIQYNNTLKKAVEEGRRSVENSMSKHKSDPLSDFDPMDILKAQGAKTYKAPTAEQLARVEAVRKRDEEFFKRIRKSPSSISPEQMEQLKRAGFNSYEEYLKKKDWVYR